MITDEKEHRHGDPKMRTFLNLATAIVFGLLMFCFMNLLASIATGKPSLLSAAGTIGNLITLASLLRYERRSACE